MRTSIRKTLAVTTVAMAFLGGTSATAFAETAPSTPIEEGVLQPGPPVEEDESGFVEAPLDEAELPPFSGKPADGPNAEYCGPPRNIYKPTANKGKSHKAVSVTQANHNGTSRTARSWFKAEAGGTVKLTYSGELKASAGVVVAELEAKYGVDLSVEVTAKLGNEVQIDTPPRKTTYGAFGVWRMHNTGTSYTIYSNCKTSAKSAVTSYTPWYVGWNLWEK
ncbi:hypothetical protein [Streptomyces sp. NPDC056524]|uniref:hypothetical protein n=1 Tax=Streptomyces sp. NPDC056524 TaxID=3345851 RepID=UPI0036A4AF55